MANCQAACPGPAKLLELHAGFVAEIGPFVVIPASVMDNPVHVVVLDDFLERSKLIIADLVIGRIDKGNQALLLLSRRRLISPLFSGKYTRSSQSRWSFRTAYSLWAIDPSANTLIAAWISNPRA